MLLASFFVLFILESALRRIAMHPPQITTKILKNEARRSDIPMIATLGTVESQRALSNYSQRVPIQSMVREKKPTAVELVEQPIGGVRDKVNCASHCVNECLPLRGLPVIGDSSSCVELFLDVVVIA